MKVLILGSNGMLGSICKRYFLKKNVHIIEFNEKYTRENTANYVNSIKEVCPDLIINCVGKIPQKNSSMEEFIDANILLPKALSELELNCTIVHASTDCVFLPTKSYKTSSSNTTATDNYGVSKAIGDKVMSTAQNTYVIRTSIVGVTDGNYSSGLLDWFINKRNGSVNGFSNHYWNGITTLAWAKFIYEYFISSQKYRQLERVTHLGIDAVVTKYQLLSIVNQVFELNIDLVKTETEVSSDRSLAVDIACGSIEKQLIDLREEFK